MFFIPFLWPTKRIDLQLRFVGFALCKTAIRALNVLVPVQLGLVVDLLHDNGVAPLWKEIAKFILLRFLVSGIGIAVIEMYLWMPIDINATQKLSSAVYNHLMSLSRDFHDSKESGSVWQTAHHGRGIIYLTKMICFQMIPSIADVFLAAGVFWRTFDPYLAFIAMAVMVFSLWVSIKPISREAEVQRQFVAVLRWEHDILTETFLNWFTVAYFHCFQYEMDRYASAIGSTQSASTAFFITSLLMDAIGQSIGLLGLLVACCLTAYQVRFSGRKPGDFVMLIFYWSQLIGPLEQAAKAMTQATRILVDAEKLFDILLTKPTVSDREESADLDLQRGEVDFDKVNFSYHGEHQVLRDISFRALPRQRFALVGETGSGKSTILKLIFRFYDVQGGSIKIDGQDLKDVKLESLRRNISVVPQDPSLFNSTILENLRYARPDASLEECQRACEAAALHEKILSFAEGYATVVGERGVKLSGGELQRMAVARAILKDSRIVLLDEATSSVDSETEARIQANLTTWVSERTAFVVAHRLSTVIHADLILVIKDGQIVERGSHNSLLELKGHYYRLWTIQTGGATTPTAPLSRRSNDSAVSEEKSGQAESVNST